MSKSNLYNQIARCQGDPSTCSIHMQRPQGWQDLFFYDEDRNRISYGYAPPHTDTEFRGTVVLTHGYDEDKNLYYETIDNYQSRGFAVYALDWEGHRKSPDSNPEDALLPSTDGLERHTDDLAFFIQNVVNPTRDYSKPLIMSTHSMGGHIGMLFLRKYPDTFDGAIMSAPMLDIYNFGLGSWSRPLFRTAFNFASRIGLRDVRLPDLEEITQAFNFKNGMQGMRQLLYNERRENDIDRRVGRPTFGWVAKAYETIVPSLQEDFLRAVRTPLLIGSAENDDLVNNEAHEYAASIIPGARHVTIEGARHGLWFEADEKYDTWWENVDAMLDHITENFDPAEDPDAGQEHIQGYTLAGERNSRSHVAVDPVAQLRLPEITPVGTKPAMAA